MNLLNVKNKKIFLIICFIINIGFLIINGRISSGGSQLIHLGNVELAVSSLAGSLQSIMFLLCIVMVCVDSRLGTFLSLFLLVFALVGSIRATVMSTSLQSLPGVIYNFVFLTVILITADQLKKRLSDSKTDFVTGLSNRPGIMERVEEMIVAKKPIHVISIRLRNFYPVRDDLGYEYGDEILKIAGQRVKAAAGKNAVIGRLDGTNFVVLISGDQDKVDVTRRIIFDLTKKIEIAKGKTTVNCHLTAYAGIASFPEHAKTTAELMRYSDIAMRHCVNEKKTFYVIFDDDLKKEFLRAGQIEGIIKDALENGYFHLVYQPQFTAAEKELKGFEVLSRLELPDGTRISPAEFIPIAEKTDLILHIDNHVFLKAMNEYGRLIMESGRKIKMSVNASGKSISSPGFAELIAEDLKKTGFSPELLEIEITEYSLGDSASQTIENISKLQAMGVSIALDDFGTGYTSLAQLLNLPVNVLKIDKSLVDRIEDNDACRDFIDSIIYMGHLMNCEVVTEGVETESQLGILIEKKCDLIQGFVWGKPMNYSLAMELMSGNFNHK